MRKLKFEDIIVAEDKDYIVINKPAGISSLHDWSSEITIQKMAKEYIEDPQLCHRLDKETSGAMVIAKNPEAYRHLSMQFEHRTVDKVYHAVVEGIQDIDPIKVERPIHAMSKGKVRIDFEKGKPATTLFKKDTIYKGYTLMLCKPQSGRMHQIRVHLSSMKMPIVGDTMYGGKEIYLSKLKKKFHLKEGAVELPLIKRFALHAFSITYKDIAGDVQYFEAPYPKDFRVLITQLEKLK